MKTVQNIVLAALLSAVLTTLCGCQTEQQKKAAFKKDYNKKASPVKLTAAQNMFEQGQLESALIAVDDILKNNPDSASAYILSGRIYLAQEQYGQARQSFEQAVALDPQSADGWFGLGVVAQSCDDHAAALDFYQKALDQNHLHSDTILAVVNTLEVLDRREEAAKLLDAKVTANPSDVKLLCAAADLANRLQQPAKAVSLYRRAMTIQPRNSRVLHAVAMTYVSSGEWGNAADVFEKLFALSKADQQEQYLYWIANCSLNAGRYSRALECFDKLSVYRRDDSQVWLGMAVSSLGIADVARAKTSAQKALSYQSDCVEAQMVCGCADYQSGKYLTALKSFVPLFNHQEFGGFASFMASRCYEKLGRADQAETTFQKAAQINPNSPLVSMFLNKK